MLLNPTTAWRTDYNHAVMAEIKGLQGEVNKKEINDNCNLLPSIKNTKTSGQNSMINQCSHI